MFKQLNPFLKCFLAVCASLYLLVFTSCSGHRENTKLQYISAKSNVWHIEIPGKGHLLTADYDGNVCLKQLPDGENIWIYPAGAFVFDMKSCDIDKDKQSETAFVTAQGEMIVLDEEGNKLWSFKSDLPLYNVAAGDFTGDEKLEIACGGIDRYVYVFDYKGNMIGKLDKTVQLVHRIAAGNLDGDHYDEILVIENRTIANLMAVRNDTLRTIWRKNLKVPNELINWENPQGNFYPFSIIIDDLDGDGTNEIIMGDTYFNKQAVMVADNQAEPVWISKRLPAFETVDDSQIEFYSTAFVRSADIFPDVPGKEVISVAGGMFRIWDKDGNLLGDRNSKVGFTDIEIDRNELYLGSSPNGDNFVYKIHLDGDWEKTVGDIEYQGLIKEIKENTSLLSRLVNDYVPVKQPEKSYNLLTGFGSVPASEKGLETYKKQMEWFNRKFPYQNLHLINSIRAIERTPPLDETGKPWSIRRWATDSLNGTMTVDEILRKARFIEEHKIPALFYIGHSCMPFITLETAEKILQAAPQYCLGFHTAEDEDINLIPRYFEHFFKPLADLCLKYGNKLCITKNKGLWWMSSPADKSVFEGMFGGERKNVSMSATEDSNSRTPEINLLGRGGLWQTGLLQNNEISIHGDLFSFNRFQQWEYPKAGHPYLRRLIAHTVLGTTQVSTRIREIMPADDSANIEAIGKESTEIFYHLLGKGIIYSPDREDILGYSPVGIVVHKPELKWLRDAHNGHSPEIWVDDPELHNAVFPHNGSLWGMTNTPDHAFQKVVFKKERQYGTQVPATPYGLVAFVPEFTDLDDVAGIKSWWHTDGISVWKEGGRKITGDEAAKALLADFEKAADQLPFRQMNDPVFMQIIRISDGHYRLVLVDPGWVNPSRRSVDIRIQMEGTYRAENILNKQVYNISDNQFSVEVQAGLFSVVDVVRQ